MERHFRSLGKSRSKKIGLELFNHKEIHIDNKVARQLRERPDDYIAILTEPTENTDYIHTGKVEDKTEKKEKTSLSPIHLLQYVSATSLHSHPCPMLLYTLKFSLSFIFNP